MQHYQILTIFFLASFCILRARAAPAEVFGYCAPYPSTLENADICAPYVQAYASSVFFYTPSVTPAIQQDGLVNATTLFNSLVQALRSADCKLVALPFMCQNLFPPCLNYTNATAADGTSFNLVVREPLCIEHCIPLETICEEILTSSLIMSQIAVYPDALRFMNCTSLDPHINNIPTFPSAPGWVAEFNGAQSVPCDYLIENTTSGQTFVFVNDSIVWPTPPSPPLLPGATVAPLPPPPTTPVRIPIQSTTGACEVQPFAVTIALLLALLIDLS